MICYRDMTFCVFEDLCQASATCDRVLTNEVQKDAEKWWGEPGAPICVYSDFPECFVREEKKI